MLNKAELEKSFSKIGAKLEVISSRWNQGKTGFQFYRKNNTKDTFVLILKEDNQLVDVKVIDINVRIKHLVIMFNSYSKTLKQKIKVKYLCGLNEKQYFAAPILSGNFGPGVEGAMHSLRPKNITKNLNMKRENRTNSRMTGEYIRQGEFFFVPYPEFSPLDGIYHKNHSLVSPKSNKHICEELVRVGQKTMYDAGTSKMLTAEEFAALPPEQKKYPNYKREVRIPGRIFVRGYVRHEEHRTIYLQDWHEVFRNTSNEAFHYPNNSWMYW